MRAANDTWRPSPAAIERRATLLISAQRVTQRADARRTEARMSRHEAQRDIAADSRVIPFCLSFFATRARARARARGKRMRIAERSK